MKTCKKCNAEKEDTEFIARKDRPGKFYTTCKRCLYTAANNWKKANLEKTKFNRMRSKLKANFNITLEQYNEMLKAQNNNCGICKEPSEQFAKNLAVDHCHSTGKIRGLLCARCNLMLGQAKDKEEILSNAIKYLKDNLDISVDKKV